MAGKYNIATWLPHSENLDEYYNGIGAFVEDNLVHPLEKSFGLDEIKSKSILDPILGYININPWEIALIDTKLFQRLRKIHQLGLAYLVFPTLTYTRFEHSLGVLGRLTLVLSKIKDNSRKNGLNIDNIVEECLIPLRLAALFHDVGHCIFSHVSERVISKLEGVNKYPSSDDISKQFESHFNKKIHFAEIFSISILGMPQVTDFLDKLGIPGCNKKKIKKHLEYAAHFIIGVPIPADPQTVFMSQLISSGLDVDKLDYMIRDAYFAGIKLEIDTERLFDKIRVFTIKPTELPLNYKLFKAKFDAGKPVHVLGLSRGGQFAFEEFCISRVALYEKIYLHQKVRAAESQLEQYLKTIPSKYSEYRQVHRWLYLTESCIYNINSALPTLDYEGDLLQISLPAKVFPTDKITKIDTRELLHRAFAFGPANSLSDPYLVSGEARPSLVAIKEIERNYDVVINEILDECKRIYEYVDTSEIQIEFEVIIDIPRYSVIQQGHDTIYFEKAPRLPLRWTLPIDKIIEYYQINRALAYVFADANHCAIVSIAAEKVIYKRYNCIFVQNGFVSSKVLDETAQLKQKLVKKVNYYEGYGILVPASEYLNSAEAQETIAELCQKMVKYESYKGQRITPSHIITFVSQFPESLHPAALVFLLYIEVVSEQFLLDSIEEWINLNLGTFAGSKVGLVPIGGALDSANHLNYFMRNSSLLDKFYRCDLMSDQLVSATDHLVLFDDNVNSGLQVLNIFAEWMNVILPENLDLQEQHVSALSTNTVDNLKKIKISLIFGIGTEGVEEFIANSFQNILGFLPENLSIYIHKKLPISKRIFSGVESKFQHPQKVELKNFLEIKGNELLLAEGKPPEKIAKRKLGYNNSEGLIIFPYNVPTMTITAIWCAGPNWIPFAERRRRKNSDGTLSDEDA